MVIGVFVADFHRAWPWSERRWRFVGSRMAELAAQRWHGDAAAIGAALTGARSVRSIAEPHLAPWLPRWAAVRGRAGAVSAGRSPLRLFLAVVDPRLARPGLGRGPAGRQRGACMVTEPTAAAANRRR